MRLRFAQKPHRRFQYSLAQGPLFAFRRRLAEVVEIGPAESAAQPVDVKIDVVIPPLIERLEKVRTDRAALRATEPLRFPYFGKHLIGIRRT